MDFLLLENPIFGKLYFSRNRIEINVEAASLTILDRSKLKYYLTIQVKPFVNAADWVDLPTMDAVENPVQDAGGTLVAEGAFFEIENILHSLVKPAVPVWGQNDILPVSDLVVPWRYKTRVENDGVLVPGTDKTSAVEYVIRAGLNEHHYEAWKDGFWVDFLKKGFLTWKPTRVVLPDEPVFLYFLNNISPTPAAVKLRVFRWYVEGHEDTEPETILVQSTQYMSVYSIPVNLSLIAGVYNHIGDGPVPVRSEVAKYMVWLTNEEGKVVSDMVTFVVDRTKYEDVRFIVFRNSLGGYDTLPIVGSVTESLKVTKDISEVYRPYGAPASFSETVINEVTGRKELILNTGWLSKAEREWLQELAVSEDVYIATDRDYLPMVLMDEGYINYDTKEDLIGRTFVFEFANAEKNYSRLPIPLSEPLRPTGWRAYGYGACELDAFGKRTGKAHVTHLEKYYLDDNSAVKPVQVKPNAVGTEGYLLPQLEASCASTPFVNQVYAQIGTFKKQTCGSGFYGTGAMITIPAGRWGSETSQTDANLKAQAEWAVLNTQAFANANGSCVPLTSGGLRTRYYAFSGFPPTNVFSSPVLLSNIMNQVNIQPGALTGLGLSPNFIAMRAVGFIQAPISGAVTFFFRSDDGQRIYMSDQPVILGGVAGMKVNNWQEQGATERSFVVNMVAGELYAITVEWFQVTGDTVLEGMWSYAGQPKVLIPSLSFYYE